MLKFLFFYITNILFTFYCSQIKFIVFLLIVGNNMINDMFFLHFRVFIVEYNNEKICNFRSSIEFDVFLLKCLSNEFFC